MPALLLALLLGNASPAPAAAPVPPAHFVITIARTGEGFRATCTAGCHWTTLAFRCVGSCEARIDDSGVYADSTTGRTGAAFAFQFHTNRKGWALDAIGGTRWLSLAWGCGGAGECAAQVDEAGVSAPAGT